MSSGGTLISVIVGLAAGIGFILIFSLMFQIDSITNNPTRVSIVTIPEDASLPGAIGFDPSIIKVAIGVNNTVRWINLDSIPSSVYADNEDDPLFYNATKDQCENNDYYNCVVVEIGKNTLMPGGTFEFTFTKPGTFGYHSVPHPQMKGTVIVLPSSDG